MRGLITNYLDKKTFLKYKDYDYYIFKKKDKDLKENGNFTFLKAVNFHNNKESYALYKTIKKDLDKFGPNNLVYRGVPLYFALLKELYWANLDSLILEGEKNKLLDEGLDIKFTYFNDNSLVRIVKRLGYLLFSGFKKYNYAFEPHGLPENPTFFVRINRYAGQKEFLKPITRAFGMEQTCLLTPDKQVKRHPFIRLKEKFQLRKGFKAINRFLRYKKITSCFETDKMAFYHSFNKLVGWIDMYYQLFDKFDSLTYLLLFASECNGEGNCATAVAHKFGVKTVNLMNGTKADDAFNLHSDFDYWFVHDRLMKDFISKSLNFPNEKLVVAGGLLEEVTVNYKYSGRLDYLKQTGKKIISFFGSPILEEEQQLALTLLKNKLPENIIVLIKAHPNQDPGFFKPFISTNILLLVDNYESILFDLFYISELTISFFSMVSYQSIKFNKPAINIQDQYIPTLYYSKSPIFYNVEVIDYLMDKITQALEYKGNRNGFGDEENVFSEVLKQYLN